MFRARFCIWLPYTESRDGYMGKRNGADSWAPVVIALGGPVVFTAGYGLYGWIIGVFSGTAQEHTAGEAFGTYLGFGFALFGASVVGSLFLAILVGSLMQSGSARQDK